MSDSGILSVATQVSMRAKDGNLENGVEHATQTFQMRGNPTSMPWSSAPCTEIITPDETSEPQVILLRLEDRDDRDDDYFFTRTHRRIRGFLDSMAKVKTAFTAGEALEYTNNDRPQAIIVLDETLTVTDPEHGDVHPATGLIMDKIKKYVSGGGRAVFCGSFDSAKFTDRAMIHYQPAGDVNHELTFDNCVFAMCGFSKLDPKLDTWYPGTSLSMSFSANSFEFNK